MKTKKIEILLSLFVLYHVFAVVMYPNPSSVLSRYLQSFVNPYGNFLGLNTTWQFFSPDPGQLRFIDYDVIIESGDDLQLYSYKWPPQDGSVFFKLNVSRRFYHSIRTILTSEMREKLLVPYLCRRHPEATSISLKTVEKFIPTIEKAKLGGADSFEAMQSVYEVPAQEFGCGKKISENESEASIEDVGGDGE